MLTEKVGERKGFRSGSERMRFCGGDVDVDVDVGAGGGGSGMVEGRLYFVCMKISVHYRYRTVEGVEVDRLNLQAG